MKLNFLILTVVLFFTLSLPVLFQRQVWFDEQASIKVAKMPVLQLLQTTARDTHPPLFFLILKLWLTLSSSYYFLRIFLQLFGVLSIVTMWRLSRVLLPDSTARMATILLAISPLHIYYSTEIRMYGVVLLLTLLFIYHFIKFSHNPSFWNSLIMLVLEMAILHTHYYAGLIIFSLSSWVMIKKKSLINHWLKIQFITALLFIPWVSLALSFPKPDCWCFSPIIGLPLLFSTLAVGGAGMITFKDVFLFGPLSIKLIFLVTSTTLFILFINSFIKQKQRFTPAPESPRLYFGDKWFARAFPSTRRYGAGRAGFWDTMWGIPRLGNPRAAAAVRMPRLTLLKYMFFLPLIIVSLTGFFISIFSPRAFIFLLPIYLIFVSIGISSIKTFSRFIFIGVCMLLILVNLLQGLHPFFTHIPDHKKNLDIETLEFFEP